MSTLQKETITKTPPPSPPSDKETPAVPKKKFFIGYDFTKSPDELVEYLRAKRLEITFNYEEMLHEAHQKSFTVAKITKLDLLSDIHLSLQEALEQGKPFSQWQDELKPTLQKKGWWGEVEAIDPRTGEVKDIFVGSRRLRTIYDTNMRTAYAKGRYEAQIDSDGEYFYYSAVMDNLTRPDHAKHHGTILPKTHKFWDTSYPPNGWRCRCKVRVYTQEELEAKGLKPSTFTPPPVADKDWAYNPGKVDKTQELYKQKIDALKCKSKNAKGKEVDCGFLKEAQKLFKEDIKTLAKMALLFPAIQELFTEKNKKVELCKSDIFGEEKRVLLGSDTVQSHIERKEITAFDYSLVPQIIDGTAFKQKENTYVIIEKFGRYYRVALKNVTDKDEIFVVSLVAANKKDDYEKWARELDKFEKIDRSKR